jgi:hypothetical protein
MSFVSASQETTMPSRIVIGFAVLAFILSQPGSAGGRTGRPTIENLLPGDTLRYTTDGSTPDRTSRFVVNGNNSIAVSRTTTIKARLYRPGYRPSDVQSHVVYVAGTRYYAYADGWNIVSVPLTVTDRRKVSIFPSAVSDAYGFDLVSGYVKEDTLQNGIGYLLRFSGQQTVAIGGSQRTLDTIAVQPDWNLIGTISVPVPVGAIRQIPPGILQSSFYGYQGGYPVADTLMPAKGYWVKVNASGSLILSTASSLNREVSPLLSVVGRAGTITVADLNGGQQVLYLSSEPLEKKDLEFFELPPLPPSGIFDARFATNRVLESATRSVGIQEVSIRVSYARFPITLSWEMKGQSISASLVIGTKEMRMKDSGSMTVGDPKAAIMLRLGTPSLRQAEFELAQNYPNPWNPSTTIRYSIPHDSFVTLRVYNTLGQQVAQLVNEQQQAGYQEVKFRGEGLASGVYFYHLEAGTISKVKKFTLLK